MSKEPPLLVVNHNQQNLKLLVQSLTKEEYRAYNTADRSEA